VQCAFDSSPVVVAEMTELRNYVRNHLSRNFNIAKRHFLAREACFRVPAEVEYNLNELANIFSLS
jgi:hypothetical protein